MQVSIKDNFDELAKRVESVKAKLPEARKEGLNGCGVQCLSWAHQDFRAKSAGQAAGGVTWSNIKDGTVKGRLAKRSPWKKIVQNRRDARAENKSAIEAFKTERKALVKQPPFPEELRRKLPKGNSPGRRKQRRAIIRAYMEAHPEWVAQVQAVKGQRKSLRTRRRKQRESFSKKLKRLRDQQARLFEKEKAAAKIGVDTGRMLASLRYGAAGPANADTVFQVTDTAVTVGIGVKYGKWFDEKRPIFGPAFIDQVRQTRLEGIFQRVYGRVLQAAMGG